MNSQEYMNIALSLARKAGKNGDVPIGAIIVNKDGKILGKGYNRKEKDNNPIKHAEMIAIKKACRKNKNWRLEECIIYSTLEPCLMCLGAIIQTRINKIVFGLESQKFGCIKTLEGLKNSKNFNHEINYTCDFNLDSKKLLQAFFSKLRNQNDMI